MRLILGSELLIKETSSISTPSYAPDIEIDELLKSSGSSTIFD